MTGWTFFFILVGVVFLTSQLFRVIDAIERPARHHTRRRIRPPVSMDVLEKLTVLTDAAKYDAACTSSGGNRTGQSGVHRQHHLLRGRAAATPSPPTAGASPC